MRQRFSKINWRRLLWVIFLLCIATPIILAAYQSVSYNEPLSIVIFGAIFLTLLLAISGVFITALPKWNYLEIDKHGFKVKLGRGVMNYKWKQCSRFFRIEISKGLFLGKKERVGCDLNNPDNAESLLKMVSGVHVVLLHDYGVNISDLVEIMNEYRDSSEK
ncbi:MAG: hypothetical protein GY742_03790 [Hyphomicrobiales bacterium]|nr:hypothetical protein [Hyphomicrobiales bacterium]